MPFTLRLNVHRNGETADIYASAPVYEPGFKFDSCDKETHDVTFHHTSLQNALRYGRMPNNRNEDFYIDFDVTMPFPEFCKALKESEWNNPKNYNRFTHNCTHAAAFALETALGVKLKLPGRFSLNRMNELSYLRMPGFVLTPYQLYLIVKEFKQNELGKNQEIDLEIARAKNKLMILKMKSDSVVRIDIDNMLKKFDESLEKNRHHAKIYKNALIATITRLSQPTNAFIKNYYFKTAAYFDNRKPSQQKRYLDECLTINLLIGFAAYYVNKAINQSKPFMLKYTMKFILLMCIYKIFYAVNGCHVRTKFNEHELFKTPIETDLSKAMRDLSTDVTLQTMQNR